MGSACNIFEIISQRSRSQPDQMHFPGGGTHFHCSVAWWLVCYATRQRSMHTEINTVYLYKYSRHSTRSKAQRNCCSADVAKYFHSSVLIEPSLPSARQHPSYGDSLEVRREYYQNCSVLGCVTQCSQSTAHSCEQFLQVQQIGFVTLGPLGHA